jgi:ankyrin repeat protein
MSLLADVCRSGNLEKLKKLVNSGTDTQSAFRWACRNGHLNVAKWLLSIEPSIDVRRFGDAAFRSACYNGHLRVAKWLLSIEPLIDIRAYKNSTFNWACKYGQFRVAKWLQRIAPASENSSMKAFKSRRVVQLISYF